MNTMVRILLLMVLIQIAVLAGMVLNALVPLWTGTAVYLKTEPVDPRSLLRGNYARLRYGISTIPTSEFSHPDRLRHGEVVFVALHETGDISTFLGVSARKPESGAFIRGRLRNPSVYDEFQYVEYGIEAYFAPKAKALRLERDLLESARAKVMIAPSGKAALVAVLSSSL